MGFKQCKLYTFTNDFGVKKIPQLISYFQWGSVPGQ